MAAITAEVYSSMGLRDDEYRRIVHLLGREPTLTELGMFSVMWSEHCGYKYSRPVLKLFRRYKASLEGKGLENAGIVDIGDGLGVTFKVESHNHPSAVEPYEGAATGVGGIIRDVLTMGARPIALLDSLRFGPIDAEDRNSESVARNRYLFERVVAGIAGYGNCVGVPTVAGEVSFHPRYAGNPLVNAMCVGIVTLERVATAAAKGPGNPVLYLGSSTGRDGIHGATFASEALGEDSDDRRPNVQIGDPFAEKSLIEATLEALETGAIVAIQDMGAAGLTCSTVEMAAKGKVGMRIDLDLVPVREQGMSALELMLSESQERMLAVAEKGREREVFSIYRKWGLHAVGIGKVTDDGMATILRGGEVVANVAPNLLTDECPTYETPAEEPAYFAKAKRFDVSSLQHPEPGEALMALVSSPSLASKRWVFRQYDFQVQTQTALIPGAGDAAVLAPRGTRKGLAVKIDGNGRQVYFDPYVGGQLAVVEAARNVACVGAKPIAVTDGLNFGNPERPHVYWQFRRAVEGIAEACEALGTPVVSGNVSFYNESEAGEVLPTPLIGMLGLLEESSARIGIAAQAQSGTVALVWHPLNQPTQEGLGASAYLAEALGIEDGRPVAPDLERELALCDWLVAAVSERKLDWAHDVSEGGLALCAAEAAIVGGRGFELDLARDQGSPFEYASTTAAALFGELPGRVLVGVAADSADELAWLSQRAETSGLRLSPIGRYDADLSYFAIRLDGETCIRCDLEGLAARYEGSLPSQMAH